MAHRPVFGIAEKPPFYFEESTEFVFNAGFSLSQKQKNIRALHDSYSSAHNDARILEISSKSENIIGVQLSAFNLPVVVGDAHTTVEAAFQSGKKFAYGGPYPDMLFSSSRTAKKDPRLKESGPLIGFELNGQQFPLEPKTFFYDWLYINAVHANPTLSESLCGYNAFTDIEFNPKKSINCQARSAAIYVSLFRAGLLEQAIENADRFRSVVYESIDGEATDQLSLF